MAAQSLVSRHQPSRRATARIARLPAVAIAFVATCHATVVLAQQPNIERLEYSQLQPGAKATIVAYGTQLNDIRSCRTPFVQMRPAEGHDPKADKTVRFEGDIPAEVVPGIYPVRLVTGGGSSEAAFVVVDDLASVAIDATAEDAAVGQAITAACCIVSQVNAVKPKVFRLPLQAGQTIGVEVFARRLNSELDPVLRLIDPTGREVAFCDDVPGLEGDATIQATAEASGEYRLELHDVRYTGGGRHFFHLRIGSFAAVASSLPRVAVPGQSVAVLNAAGDAQGPPIVVPESTNLDALANIAAHSDGQVGSTLLAVSTSAGPALLEQEPNEDRESATPVGASVRLLSGTLQQRGDVDWFRLSTEQATSLCITTHTRDVRSPADVLLQLWSADGNKLAEADESGPLDAQLVASLPAAGEYLLRVAELGGQGGAQWTYDMEISRAEGRIEVTLPADRINVPRGGSASIAATVKRIHTSGPLLLQPVGLPASISMQPLWLGEKQSTVPLTLTATDAPSEELSAEQGPVELQFTATDGSATAAPVVIRLTPPAVKKKDADPFRSSRGRSDVFTAVAPAAQFSLLPDPAVVVVKKGESATCVVKATRHADWPMPIELSLAAPADQLPAGLTVANVTLEGGETTLTITTTADTPPGKCTLFLQGKAKKDKEEATHPVPPIVVDVTE